MDWISVKNAPLIYTSPTGAKYPTEEGKKRFLCAVPYMGKWECRIVWWISFITLNDDCSIHEVGFDDNDGELEEYLNFSGHDITHYIPEPLPPEEYEHD